jgi:PAS domain S-box-containing protein
VGYPSPNPPAFSTTSTLFLKTAAVQPSTSCTDHTGQEKRIASLTSSFYPEQRSVDLLGLAGHVVHQEVLAEGVGRGEVGQRAVGTTTLPHMRYSSQRAEGLLGSLHQGWLDQIASVMETLNQGVILNDSAKRVVYANSMFLDMIGMEAGQLLGRSMVDFFPTEDVPRLLEFIGQREVQGRARYEFYIPQADGGHLPVVVTSRQIQDPEGRTFAVVTATDISEQKRAETELRNANEQLLVRQRQMEAELQLAERVQQSLAPRSLSWGGAAVETHYQPAWSVGGDYGLVVPNDDHLDVLVCDVSGHGISSALVANRIYSETMSQIERSAELGAMLRSLNHFVVQHLASSTFFFTVAAVRLDRSCRSLQFAGAGHPPAMIVRPGETPKLLESRSGILGLFENAVDADSTIESAVEPGDRVLIYTDGLTENFNLQQEMLGVEGLSEIVRDASHLSLPDMKRQILDRVEAWRHGPATDDVSVVLVEIS